jgi:alkylhydroperoxidase/carboxymuconolactone decarboxylase family protein YurZ
VATRHDHWIDGKADAPAGAAYLPTIDPATRRPGDEGGADELMALAMTAALGRMDEFRLHAGASGRAGVTDDELDELLFQVAAYCGVAAKRAVQAVRVEREAAGP